MTFWLALTFALLMMSSRFCVIAKFGVQELYMDSFSKIQDYKAAKEGQLGETFGHSISFHIEHRTFLTRWLNVGLFLANHKHWDLLMQTCVNAGLAGVCVLVIIRGFGAHFVDFWYWLFCGLTTVCFASPSAYENTLWGFSRSTLSSARSVTLLGIASAFRKNLRRSRIMRSISAIEL